MKSSFNFFTTLPFTTCIGCFYQYKAKNSFLVCLCNPDDLLAICIIYTVTATDQSWSDVEEMNNSSDQCKTVNFSKNINATSVCDEKAVNRLLQTEWIVAEAYNAFAIIILVWITLSFLIYGVRTGKWQKSKVSFQRPSKSSAVYTTVVIATNINLVHLLLGPVAYNAGYNDHSSGLCEIFLDIWGVSYIFTVLGVYNFLWFRQRAIYQQHAVRSVRGKYWTAIHRTSAVIIATGYGVTIFSSAIPENYERSKYGCKLKPWQEFTTWPIYFGNVMKVLGQALLLYLFLKPLCSRLSSFGGKRIRKCMVRSTIYAIVAVTSDILTTIMFVYAIPEGSTAHVVFTTYDVNMLINTLGIAFTFETWKKILTSPYDFCCRKKIVENSAPARNLQIRKRKVTEADSCQISGTANKTNLALAQPKPTA